jgi:hypothetical protein
MYMHRCVCDVDTIPCAILFSVPGSVYGVCVI